MTANLRTYKDVQSDVGGYDWWSTQANSLDADGSLAFVLVASILAMLESAARVGSLFYVEQMSIVLGKDPQCGLNTLVPKLHSDLYYGMRESALCSILEKGFNPFGGTLSAPTLTMSELEQHGDVDMARVEQLLSSAPFLKLGSGDLLLHDGMIGPDGDASAARGLPHISPDVPGLTSRLVFLMRHKKRSNAPLAGSAI